MHRIALMFLFYMVCIAWSMYSMSHAFFFVLGFLMAGIFGVVLGSLDKNNE